MRMEIDHWWNSEDHIHQDQVSLFIKALKIFQGMDIKDKLSYFAIAGESSIHGFVRDTVANGSQASIPSPGFHGMRAWSLAVEGQGTATTAGTLFPPGIEHIFFSSRYVANPLYNNRPAHFGLNSNGCTRL